MNKILYLKNYLIPYLILIIVVIISFFPFFWMISTSLMTIGETINRSLIPESPQWINYSTTWNEGKFSKYLINSFIITFVSVFGLLITSIFATDLKLGEDNETKIDFEDVNQINLYAKKMFDALSNKENLFKVMIENDLLKPYTLNDLSKKTTMN